MKLTSWIPEYWGEREKELWSCLETHWDHLINKRVDEFIKYIHDDMMGYGHESPLPVDQAAGIINTTLTNLSKEPLYGSILQSIMRKKTSEIDYINGEVVSLARNVGDQAPLNRKVVDLVHKVEEENRFFEPQEVKKEFNLLNQTRSG